MLTKEVLTKGISRESIAKEFGLEKFTLVDKEVVLALEPTTISAV